MCSMLLTRTPNPTLSQLFPSQLQWTRIIKNANRFKLNFRKSIKPHYLEKFYGVFKNDWIIGYKTPAQLDRKYSASVRHVRKVRLCWASFLTKRFIARCSTSPLSRILGGIKGKHTEKFHAAASSLSVMMLRRSFVISSCSSPQSAEKRIAISAAKVRKEQNHSWIKLRNFVRVYILMKPEKRNSRTGRLASSFTRCSSLLPLTWKKIERKHVIKHYKDFWTLTHVADRSPALFVFG